MGSSTSSTSSATGGTTSTAAPPPTSTSSTSSSTKTWSRVRSARPSFAPRRKNDAADATETDRDATKTDMNLSNNRMTNYKMMMMMVNCPTNPQTASDDAVLSSTQAGRLKRLQLLIGFGSVGDQDSHNIPFRNSRNIPL